MTAFEENENILFALPLYVENVPGIMLEFLACLSAKERPGTRISFLLQGGFPEVSQGRCCEEYLKTLPAQLGCGYGGTFIKGDMFGLSLLGKKMETKLLQPFIEIGRQFGESGTFRQETIEAFSKLNTGISFGEADSYVEWYAPVCAKTCNAVFCQTARVQDEVGCKAVLWERITRGAGGNEMIQIRKYNKDLGGRDGFK